MPVYEFNGKRPTICDDTWIAPGAIIIGNVTIGRRCYIGFGAVIRGDFGLITIGDETAVEDNSVIHCADRCTIGSHVILGHCAMVHNAVIGNWSLVGMSSLVSDNAVVEEWTIIAEKTHVEKNQILTSGNIYSGNPACLLKKMEERHRTMLRLGVAAYADLCDRYESSLKRVD